MATCYLKVNYLQQHTNCFCPSCIYTYMHESSCCRPKEFIRHNSCVGGVGGMEKKRGGIWGNKENIGAFFVGNKGSMQFFAQFLSEQCLFANPRKEEEGGRQSQVSVQQRSFSSR